MGASLAEHLQHGALSERLQAEFPAVKVVKTLTTLNYAVTVNPNLVPGEHKVFLSGNDADAEATCGAGSANGSVGRRTGVSISATSRRREVRR